jgi:hypothetical protein
LVRLQALRPEVPGDGLFSEIAPLACLCPSNSQTRLGVRTFVPSLTIIFVHSKVVISIFRPIASPLSLRGCGLAAVTRSPPCASSLAPLVHLSTASDGYLAQVNNSLTPRSLTRNASAAQSSARILLLPAGSVRLPPLRLARASAAPVDAAKLLRRALSRGVRRRRLGRAASPSLWELKWQWQRRRGAKRR